MLTYGDGVSNVDIKALVAFHQSHGKMATITSVQPAGRFGALLLDEKQHVKQFTEKPRGDGAWINGGFFVMEPEAIDYIEDDSTVWEGEPMEKLAQDGMLTAYRHYGYWQNMDSLRDKNVLEELWQSGNPPWKIW